MKRILVITLLLYALAFTVTALAHAAGGLRFSLFTALSLASALVVSAIVPFACCDYGAQPLFPLRRARRGENIDPVDAPADALPPWTSHPHGTAS